MKLERFFEKFEQFADAPNAVAKMRELVLRLAMQGKLVEQDPNDESADILLERIRKTRARLINERAIKRLNTDSISDEQTPFVIPASWVWTRLGEIGDWGSGSTPTRGNHELYGGGITWLKSGELNDNQALAGSAETVTEFALKAGSFRRNKPGDVLLAMYGATIGKAAILAEPAVTNQAVCGCTPFDGVVNRYLFNFLVSQRINFHAASEGGAQPNISKVKIVGHPFPLPPLAEQKRIVAKVDELMALCDRLEAQQQERDTRHAALARASLARFAEAHTPANLDFLFHPSYTITPADLRKSILTLAVQGKLVPQDPNDESAHNLLERINKELTQISKVSGLKIRKAKAVDETEIPFAIPECWAWASLAEIGFINPRNFAEDDLPASFVPMALISEYYGVANRHEIRKWKDIKTGYTHFAEGDVSLAKITPCFENGKSTIFRALTGGIGAGTTELHVVRPVLVSPEYVLVFLKSSHFIENGIPKMTGTAGQKRVPTEYFADSLFPLPPLAEQRRIVAKVDQLMALVDQLESQLAAAKSKSAALLDAVVHELLNSSAEVIDLANYRAAIGCYTIRKMSSQPYFGRTAAMKMFYLAQAHVGMQLGLQPEREAAGPLDQWLYRFEDEGQRQGWFKAIENQSNGKMKVEYQPGKALAEQAAQGENLLSPEQRKEFDRLLNLLSGKKTEEVEIIATLFAAWNDFLIDDHVPSDDEIVTEVRENWHVKKERFTPAQLRQWLGWLRQNNLVPQGRLPHTVHQSKLSLN